MNARLHPRTSPGPRRPRSARTATESRLERRVKDLERLVGEQAQLIRELSSREDELRRQLNELSPSPKPTGTGKSRLPEDQYRGMVEAIRQVVEGRLPRQARVLVVSKGDDE